MEFYFREKWEISEEDIHLVFDMLKNNFLILNRSKQEYLQILTLGNNYTIEVRKL